MSRISLRRIDDSQRVTVECSEEPRVLAPDRTAYEAGYRRIVGEHEVPPGQARIFETGGSSVLIVRDTAGICAFDAAPLVRVERTPHLLHAQRFVIEPPSPQQETSHQLQALAVRIEDGWIWIDAD